MNFSPITTLAGRAAEQAAKVAGAPPLRFARMVFGDGGGASVNVLETQTGLVNQLASVPLDSVIADPANPNLLWIAATYADPAPPAAALAQGYSIREIGIVLDSGVLYGIGSCPDTYLPLPSQGAVRAPVFRTPWILSNGSATITLLSNPAQFATQQWVYDNTTGVFARLLQGIAVLGGQVRRLTDFARNTVARLARLEQEVVWLRAQADRANRIAGLPPADAPAADTPPPHALPPFSATQPDPAPSDPGERL